MKKNNHIISYYVFYIFFFLVIKWSIIYNKYKKLIKIAYNNYYASAAPLLLCALKGTKGTKGTKVLYREHLSLLRASNCFK